MGTMRMATVETIAHDGWAELVMNRPERRNAIDGDLAMALAGDLRALDTDDDVHAILLRGAEGVFCSGLDLKAFNADPPPEWLPKFNVVWRAVHTALYDCGKPVIAAFESYGINGGASLALAADLLIAGETAFLQVGEVRQGMVAPYNIAWLRLRHPESVAAKLTLTGRRFTGSELAAMGVAYTCVPDEEVLPRAQELAAELASYPAGAAVRIKATMRAYNDASASAWFDQAIAASPATGRLSPRAAGRGESAP